MQGDNVNSPSHYTQGYVETIYAIAQTLGPEGFKAYCMGNWIKYNARAKYKNNQEDLKKAEVYLGWAVNGLPAPVEGKVPQKETLAEPQMWPSVEDIGGYTIPLFHLLDTIVCVDDISMHPTEYVIRQVRTSKNLSRIYLVRRKDGTGNSFRIQGAEVARWKLADD